MRDPVCHYVSLQKVWMLCRVERIIRALMFGKLTNITLKDIFIIEKRRKQMLQILVRQRSSVPNFSPALCHGGL